MDRRTRAEAEERAKKQRRADLEGWRLLAVRAAERAGFWYTANLVGFGGGDAAGDEPTLLSLAAPPVSIVCSAVNGGGENSVQISCSPTHFSRALVFHLSKL